MLVNRLSRLMGARRLSIQDVATATGLSYTTVFQLYHDKSTRFDRETLDRLCAHFGVGLGDILEWTTEDAEDQEGQALAPEPRGPRGGEMTGTERAREG